MFVPLSLRFLPPLHFYSHAPSLLDSCSLLTFLFFPPNQQGAGPITGCIDPTATGNFKDCIELKTVTQVPGNGGRIKAPKKNNNGKRGSMIAELWDRGLDALEKRGIIKRAAKNVNQDYPMKFSVPDGTTCSGTVNGLKNVCLVKIANPSPAGAFGGVVPIQIPDAGGNNNNGTAPANPGAGAAAVKAAAGSNNKANNKANNRGNNKANSNNNKNNRRAVEFSA